MHPDFVAECTPTWNFVLKQTLTYTSLYILATDKSTNNLKYFENLCHGITRLKSFLSRFIFSGGYFIILILKNEIWPPSVPNTSIIYLSCTPDIHHQEEPDWVSPHIGSNLKCLRPYMFGDGTCNRHTKVDFV